MLDAVIPAFPYEGAFLWFLGDDSVRRFKGSYYESLYGPRAENAAVRAAALASLFPEIILAPADAQLPDSAMYLSGRAYHHPGLRLTMKWTDDHEWSDETQEVAKAAAADPVVATVLTTVGHLAGDPDRQHHFLSRLVLQNRLAIATGATLVGNSIFQRLSALVAPYMGGDRAKSQLTGVASKLPIAERSLDIVGLNFAPGTRDAFAAIRSSQAITRYAESFRNALASASSQANLDDALLQLMREAMDNADVAAQVAGGLETSGSALNIIGFIPLVGNIASAMGVGTDAGSRAAEKFADKKSWYLIGAKMHEVAISDLLKRKGAS